MTMYAQGVGETVTVTLDSGVRLRRNAMESLDVAIADVRHGREQIRGGEMTDDLRCFGGGITKPAFLSIKEERYSK